MYATREDLHRLALPPQAVTTLLDPVEGPGGEPVENPALNDTINECLQSASGVIDGYLAARFILPLITWGEDLKRACSIIAAYDLMTVRGHSPHGPDENLRLRYEDILRWLRDVSTGKIHPQVEDSSTDEDPGGSPIVDSKPPRGW